MSKVVIGKKRGPVRAQDAQIKLAIKEGDFQSVCGGGVAMTVRDTMNQSLETKPPEVISHLCGSVR